MKYIQAILAFVAITSVSARALPADGTLAVRDTDTSLTSRSNEDLSASDLDEVNSIVEGLTGKNPGLEKKAVEVINSAHFPTLASRKKHNGTATDAVCHNPSMTISQTTLTFMQATATGTADAAAKAAKKAAKASARASKVCTFTVPLNLLNDSNNQKSAAAAAAAETATTAAVKRNLDIVRELESRKKHNGTATTNAAVRTYISKLIFETQV